MSSSKILGSRRQSSASWRVVIALALCIAFLTPTADARLTAAHRLKAVQSCQPNDVPPEQRCSYVREHKACRPDDGLIPYLEVHYCYLNQLDVATTLLFLLWIAILFGMMLLVAERFFCPSLELISEYLRLPPCVAGATLLSFGNGAPDVFTQLAAISQGDAESASSPDAISMALSEPLGSGLFVGHVVFALVIIKSGLKEVRVQRSYFLKDCLFYLGGVGMVLGFLLHGVVMVWEVAVLAGYYLLFMAATVLLSRGDEPVHADPRLHEVPHRLAPLDSYLRESFRRITDNSLYGGSDDTDDAEAPLLPYHHHYAHHGPPSSSPSRHSHHPLALEPIEEDGGGGQEEEEEEEGDGGGNAVGGDGGGGGDGTYQPPPELHVELDVEGGEGNGNGVAAPVSSAPVGTSVICAPHREEEEAWVAEYFQRQRNQRAANAAATSTYPPGEQQPINPFAACQTGKAGATAPSASPRGLPALSPTIHHHHHQPPSSPSSSQPTNTGSWWGREAGSAGQRVPVSGSASWGGGAAGGGGGGGGSSPPRVSLSASTSLRREGSGRPRGRMEALWRRMERPALAALSLFMPRVAIDTHARYRKTCAVLLPPLLPTLVGWGCGWLDPSGGFWRQPWWLVSTGVGLAVAAAAVVYYPRKGHLHGYAAGIATVVVFCEAMVLLDGSAGELVSAAVALGQIYGISPSLLGSTLLAWGNSVSDLVSNTTLAADGLPTMAITACFASPLFVLLAGLVTSLTYATRHGTATLPPDLALRVLYGSSVTLLAMWSLVVPLVFRFRLNRVVALMAMCLYLCFQGVYIWAVVRDARV